MYVSLCLFALVYTQVNANCVQVANDPSTSILFVVYSILMIECQLIAPYLSHGSVFDRSRVWFLAFELYPRVISCICFLSSTA